MKSRLLTSLLAFLAVVGAAFARTEVPDSAAGRYLWLPDSLASDVEKLKTGNYIVTRNPDIVDESEKVVYRGDTISMVMRDRNIGRFSRGLLNYLFIPKNNWMFGITASYGEFSSSDLQMMDILTDFDFAGHAFSINPYVSYFIKNNLSLGVRMGYSNTRGEIGSMGIDFDEDLNFDIHDVMYRSESLSAAIFVRQYIGLQRRGRFGVFNELEMAFSSGNSDFSRPFDNKIKNTHTTYSEMRLNFSPGVTIFINRYASFNLQFGVVGFYLRNEKQDVDGVESGNRLTSGANFRFNIFNINFGLGIHL